MKPLLDLNSDKYRRRLVRELNQAALTCGCYAVDYPHNQRVKRAHFGIQSGIVCECYDKISRRYHLQTAEYFNIL
jgi:hypothetical protein